MKTQNHPKWWLLYLLAPLLGSLLVVDHHLPLSPLEHQFVQAGAILLLYSLMACWLWANQAVLESDSDEQEWQPLDLAAAQREPTEFSGQEEPEAADVPAYQVIEPTAAALELPPVVLEREIRYPAPRGARLN